MNRSALAGVMAALLFCAPAAAQEKAPQPPLFLTAADIDQAVQLPQPPPEGSPAALAELAELHQIQDARTPERLARAKWDGETENGGMFAPTLGPGFDLAKLPATARMLADVRHDEKLAATRAKVFYLRKRPWIVDPTLQPCSESDKPLSSYTSGHSTMAYAMAVVLADAFPAKADAIMARADDYAESRLVCGVHFRSDVAGGKILGEEMGRSLLAKPAFKAEEQEAAKELRSLQ